MFIKLNLNFFFLPIITVIVLMSFKGENASFCKNENVELNLRVNNIVKQF